MCTREDFHVTSQFWVLAIKWTWSAGMLKIKMHAPLKENLMHIKQSIHQGGNQEVSDSLSDSNRDSVEHITVSIQPPKTVNELTNRCNRTPFGQRSEQWRLRWYSQHTLDKSYESSLCSHSPKVCRVLCDNHWPSLYQAEAWRFVTHKVI